MREYLMEAIGTFFLVLAIGLTKDPIVIGIVLASMIYLGAHVSGAHYNPAVSFSFFLMKKLSLKKLIGYSLGQITGAFTAAAFIVFISTLPYYVEPPFVSNLYQQVSVEVLFTCILVMVYITVSSSKALTGNKMYGFVIGFTLTGLTLMGSAVSGSIFNPAISIGTSAFDFLLGGASYLNIPLYTIAPLTGGALAAATYRYLNY